MKYIMLCLVPLFSSNVSASDFSLGLGGTASAPPYKYKSKNIYSPLPMFNYQNKYLYADTSGIGIKLFEGERQRFSLFSSYDGSEFNPEDAIKELEKVSKRKSTVYAGFGYNLYTGAGDLAVNILQDTLGKSQGMKVNASWSVNSYYTQWILGYNVGVEWNNKKQNQYYYGVDKKESLKSDVSTYESKSSFTPYTGVNITYLLNDKWTAAVFVDAYFIPNQQKHSPLSSGKDVLYSVGGVVTYTL